MSLYAYRYRYKYIYIDIDKAVFEHSLCRKLSLASFLYIPNVWMDTECMDIYTECMMATVIVMVRMMQILFFIKISIGTKSDLNPI